MCFKLRIVRNGDLFFPTRNSFKILVKGWDIVFNELLTFWINLSGKLYQLPVPHFQHLQVEIVLVGKLLQQDVSLSQYPVIVYQVVEIKLIKLGNNTIYKPAPDIASIVYQVTVVGRNHHQRIFTDVIGKAAVLLLIQFEAFFLVALLNALDGIRFITIYLVFAEDGKIIFGMIDIL